MCEVLDMIEKRGYDTGYDQGDESRARRDAIKMYQKGINTEDIADIIGTGIETILDRILQILNESKKSTKVYHSKRGCRTRQPFFVG